MKKSILYLFLPLALCWSFLSRPQALARIDALNNRFIQAARIGSIDQMNTLIRKGADVNSCNGSYGSTALNEAAWDGCLDCLKALIAVGADVNARSKNGSRAIDSAARFGHLDCLRALIDAKANVNLATRSGFTALHTAACYGHTEFIKALLEAKANVNARDSFGTTALHRAAQDGHIDCVKVLIAAKADLNIADYKGRTALYFAARSGHVPCVKAFLEANTDVMIQDCYGNTALHIAILKRHFECVKAFVAYSYLLVPSERSVSKARKRIFNALLQFVRLRNQHPDLDNLKAESLQFEILSKSYLLQKDLVRILLDELNKGKEIKGIALIRSKEAAVSYLLKKLDHLIAKISASKLSQDLRLFLDRPKLEELVKQGLNERIEALKVKAAV